MQTDYRMTTALKSLECCHERTRVGLLVRSNTARRRQQSMQDEPPSIGPARRAAVSTPRPLQMQGRHLILEMTLCRVSECGRHRPM